MDLIADTSFLVGLWRRQPWAVEFSAMKSSAVVGIPWVVRGEFLHGARRARHDEREVNRFLELGLQLHDPTLVIPVYARICADLQASATAAYRAIGQNDLWIAATAVSFDKPLVTRNHRHFGDIPDLRLQAIGTR